MACGIAYRQLDIINTAMRDLRRLGIPLENPAMRELYKLRGEVMGKLGLKIPRVSSILRTVSGLSPGIVRVWFDSETGFMAEGRPYPEAPPVYHAISVEEAALLVAEEPPSELLHRMFLPTEYIGE